MDITIRKMIPGDLDQVIRILSEWNMAPVQATDQCPTPERSSVDVANSFVALDGDKVIGVCSYIILSPESAETASLAVHPKYKGKGIGYLLQEARLKEMKGRGIKLVRTETDRPETIEWYIKKFGYRVVGQNKKKHQFSLAHVDHWIVLELKL